MVYLSEQMIKIYYTIWAFEIVEFEIVCSVNTYIISIIHFRVCVCLYMANLNTRNT